MAGPLVKNGKTILSGIDPSGRAERVADAVAVKDRTLYFCPSPLYGYGLARLLSRLETTAPNSAVLCIEADPELFDLSKKNIDASLLEKTTLHLTDISDREKLCSLVRNRWGERTFRRVEVVRLSGGWQLFSELYDSLCETLRREIASDWSNALTLAKLGRLYIRNTLRNLSLTTRFSSASNLSFGSASVLVLGAGPSLDETLDELDRHFAQSLRSPESRSFKIICVDTCLCALKDRGIIPDLTVILESQHWNLRDFIGCRGWNVPSAVDLSSLPASTRLLAGDGYLFFTPWTPLKIFERLKNMGLLPAVVPPLGSVGLTAVELARRITSGKIICAGIDFSFTPDKYHARSTPGHRSKLDTQTRLRRILNTAPYNDYSTAAVSKSGLSVYTSPSMKNYCNLFEQEFGGDSRLFDIESDGLPLGIKTLSMETAITLLKTDSQKSNSSAPVPLCEKNEGLILFFESEKKRLEELRSILTGESAADQRRLALLIDECDYLWAHFPDCSVSRRPDLTDISFLKRVRAEIDPMLELIGRRESTNYTNRTN
ncbi:MAG: DUF115 domain-containing protein [Treponema sp.]|nr:DUF115 domain-containing protein [Treponema sp.]